MEFSKTEFPGLVIIQPRVFRDERGFFLESYQSEFFATNGIAHDFIQDNHARSEDAGVLRGLHFQLPPFAQGKLVWVTRGSVFDVAVDLRNGSPTFGKTFSTTLSADNFTRLFIPRGFAHGYMTLEVGTEFQYKVDAYYAPAHEAGIIWNDPDLSIPWPENVTPILSPKDQNLQAFRDFSSPFVYTSGN